MTTLKTFFSKELEKISLSLKKESEHSSSTVLELKKVVQKQVEELREGQVEIKLSMEKEKEKGNKKIEEVL